MTPDIDDLNKGPKILSDFNPSLKEIPDVHVSLAQLDTHEIRALKGALAPGLKGADFSPTLSRHLGQILPSHQKLIERAIKSQKFLFGGVPDDEAPLWMCLLRRQDGGLRQVSQEWLRAATHLFARFAIEPSPALLAQGSVQHADLAYRLGLYSLAWDLIIQTRDDKEDISVRMAIACGKSSLYLLNQDSLFHGNDGLQESLLASFLVQEAKQKNKPNNTLVERLANWVEIAAKIEGNDSFFARVCHVLNSLSYVWMKAGNTSQTEWAIQQLIISIAPRIDDVDLRQHVLGNAFYHRAILAGKAGDSELELAFLKEAARLDPGFSDYDYRMAGIFHDRGSIDAKIHYEASIATGPFHRASVNDYGFFLNEAGYVDELKSWENVASLLFSEGDASL